MRLGGLLALAAGLLFASPALAQQAVNPCTKSGINCAPASLTSPLVVGASSGPTYIYSTIITVAVSPQDVLLDCGSATKTVVVESITVAAGTTSASAARLHFSLRSTPDTGGTGSTVSAVESDSSQSGTATATVTAFTANPTSGTVVGDVLVFPIQFLVDGAQNLPFVANFVSTGSPIVLHGANSCLALNLGAATLSGSNFLYVTVVQTEQ